MVLKDLHPFLDDPEVVRGLRELAQHLKSSFTTAVLLSPVLKIAPELEKEITVVDVPLPTYEELLQLLGEIVTVVHESRRATVNLERDRVEELVRAAQGLTLAEAENVFARAIADDGKLDASDVAMVLEEKQQIVRKSGLLEYYPVSRGLDQIGGLELLKEWLVRRRAAFGEQARRFGLPEPKGILLLGVQGCGKSLTAKAVAAEWRLPLLRLDVGRIFSSFVGSSEQNLRRAIGVAESVAPVVLWIDEVEKGLSGVSSSGAGDSGVSARVFGNLLIWLQEKTAPVFVVATANRIDLLPPEFLRKGRFDEIFFVDLPSEAERGEIFRIHLRGKNRDPERFDVDALAALSMGWSGAEIEQAIVAGLYDAFSEGTELSQVHIEQALRATVPLSRTMADNIDELEELGGDARATGERAGALRERGGGGERGGRGDRAGGGTVTKHARFLHIEQRRDDEGPESEAADRGRIAAVLGASPVSGVPSDATIELDPEARAGDGSTRVAPTIVELAGGAGHGRERAVAGSGGDRGATVRAVQALRGGLDDPRGHLRQLRCAARHGRATSVQRAALGRPAARAGEGARRPRGDGFGARGAEARGGATAARAGHVAAAGAAGADRLGGRSVLFRGAARAAGAAVEVDRRRPGGGSAAPAGGAGRGDPDEDRVGCWRVLLVLSMFPRRVGTRLLQWWTGRG